MSAEVRSTLSSDTAISDISEATCFAKDTDMSVNSSPSSATVAAVCSNSPTCWFTRCAAFAVSSPASAAAQLSVATDNWAAAEAGDETAKAAQRVNQQVGLLLQTAATVADDGDELTDISVSLAKQVASEISEIAVSDESVDLTSADTLTEVLSEAPLTTLRSTCLLR